MANIREPKGKRKKWQAQVRMAGYPHRTASFSTRRQAERWAKTIEAEMIEGRHFKNGAGRTRMVTEAVVKYAREILKIEGIPDYEAGNEYEAKLAAFQKRKWVKPTHPDAPSDARNSFGRLMWWRKELRDFKLAAITTELIEDKLSKLRTEPFQRSKPDQKNSVVRGQKPRLMYRTEKTVNRYVAAGSRLFKIAWKRWHWITGNPFSGIERAKEHGGRIKTLKPDERASLFAEIRKDPTLYAFSSTARATVVRAGDLQKLRKVDVEFIEPVDPKQRLMGRLAIQQPKNKEPRIVWIAGEPAEVLRDYIAKGDPKEPRVFVSHSGRLYRYHKPFVDARKRAGITSDFTFHGFRHDGATHLARLGATEQQLQAIGGWKSGVVKKYVHLAAEDARGIVERMNKALLEQKEREE